MKNTQLLDLLVPFIPKNSVQQQSFFYEKSINTRRYKLFQITQHLDKLNIKNPCLLAKLN